MTHANDATSRPLRVTLLNQFKAVFAHPPGQLPAPHTLRARNVIRVLEDQKLDATDAELKKATFAYFAEDSSM